MENNNEKKSEEQSTINSGEGLQQEADSKIKQANDAAERLEKAKREADESVMKLEALEANKILSGTAEAGTETTPQFTDEEKASRARIKAVADASGSPWGKKYE